MIKIFNFEFPFLESLSVAALFIAIVIYVIIAYRRARANNFAKRKSASRKKNSSDDIYPLY